MRQGFQPTRGIKAEAAERIVKAHATAHFECTEELARLADMDDQDMRQLPTEGALRSLSGRRCQQAWGVTGLRRPPVLLRQAPVDELFLTSRRPASGEEVVWD